MTKKSTYSSILSNVQKGKKQFAVLIDPDKFNPTVIDHCNKCKVEFIFIGGSTVAKQDFENCINYTKGKSKIPVIIFPGDENQLSSKADALLLLSLISGRNPDYLIGKHVLAAPAIVKSKIETISTGYILVGDTAESATSKISNTEPIAEKNSNLILATAQAAALIGMQAIYLEAGSGAKKNISAKIIKQIKRNINLPLIVGGGISSPKSAKEIAAAGADLIVVGNAVEKNINLISEIASAIKALNTK